MFGSKMYHMKNAMKNKFYLQEENCLTVTDIDLGGYNWNYAEFKYVNDQFCDAFFTKTFKEKESVSESFEYLKNKLDNKYYRYKVEDNCNSHTVIYDDTKNVCMLNYEYSESKSGEMYWYLHLYYWNINLSKEAMKKQDDEL